MRNRGAFTHLLHAAAMAVALLFSGCLIIYRSDSYAPNTLIVQNDFDAVGSIWYLYLTPSTSSTWGPDLLGGDILQPGDELIVDLYSCNRHYDIRVAYDDDAGPVVEERDVWLPCRTTTIVSFIDW